MKYSGYHRGNDIKHLIDTVALEFLMKSNLIDKFVITCFITLLSINRAHATGPFGKNSHLGVAHFAHDQDCTLK